MSVKDDVRRAFDLAVLRTMARSLKDLPGPVAARLWKEGNTIMMDAAREREASGKYYKENFEHLHETRTQELMHENAERNKKLDMVNQTGNRMSFEQIGNRAWHDVDNARTRAKTEIDIKEEKGLEQIKREARFLIHGRGKAEHAFNHSSHTPDGTDDGGGPLRGGPRR